jgi:hypothetical protein
MSVGRSEDQWTGRLRPPCGVSDILLGIQPAVMGFVEGIGFTSMVDEAFHVKYHPQMVNNEPWETTNVGYRLRQILFRCS